MNARTDALREVLAAICDEDQRRAAAYANNRGSGLGWEAARDIVQQMLTTAECDRCKGSGIDPEHSTAGDWYSDFPEPPALEPCIACQRPADPAPIRCTRCGEDDGPFVDNGMCEDCARVVSL